MWPPFAPLLAPFSIPIPLLPSRSVGCVLPPSYDFADASTTSSSSSSFRLFTTRRVSTRTPLSLDELLVLRGESSFSFFSNPPPATRGTILYQQFDRLTFHLENTLIRCFTPGTRGSKRFTIGFDR